MKTEDAIRILSDTKFLSPIGQAACVAIGALEKQKPMKPICETTDDNGVEYEFEHYKCPNCKIILHQRYKKSKTPMEYNQKFCHECGQKLNWDKSVIEMKISKKVRHL